MGGNVTVTYNGPPNVTVERSPNGNMVTTAAGPQGAQGPQGVPGTSSAPQRYDQTSPAGVWTITHNLNRSVIAQVFIGGQVVITDLDDTNPNVLSVTFATPQVGYVLYS